MLAVSAYILKMRTCCTVAPMLLIKWTADDLDSSEESNVHANDDDTVREFMWSENGQFPHSWLAFSFAGKRCISTGSVKWLWLCCEVYHIKKTY